MIEASIGSLAAILQRVRQWFSLKSLIWRQRREGCLERVAFYLPDQPRYQVARKTSGQLPQELARPVLTDVEMGRSGDPIEKMQVVGQDTGCEECLAQRHQRIWIVVDPVEKDRLVEHMTARGSHSPQRRGHISVDLARMIGMHDDRHRHRDRREPPDQSRIDSRGQDHRHPCVNAETVDVGNPCQRAGQRCKLVVGQHQWIATAEDDFTNRPVSRDCFNHRLPTSRGRRVSGVREFPSEAIAAVDSARAAGDQKGTTGIFPQQPWPELGIVVSHRVRPVAADLIEFGLQWQDLQKQWIPWVTIGHPGDEAPRHSQSEIPRGRMGRW